MKKKSPTLKESTCLYCKKTVETELNKRCNCYACLYYIFSFFYLIPAPIICIFTCDLSVFNQNCCCCIGSNCDCCNCQNKNDPCCNC